MHHIPNIISVFRIFLILPIAIHLQQESWEVALVLIFIGGLSDALDGFLARRFSWQSRLGAFLDPIADKLLLIVIFVSLANKELIPLWLAFLVVARDAIIVVGASFYQWKTHALEISPLISSKVNTGVQVIFVLGLLVHLAVLPLSDSLLLGLKIAVAVTTVVSGILYVICWSRNYKNHLSQATNKSA
ncbi:MAG: CDP-alcohol phosphatidyltransferase family protein [Cocleimonas sp.]